MTYSVIVVAKAQRQAFACDGWWRAHRKAAPDLFQEELDHAVDSLSTFPDRGQLCPSRGKPVRYLVLARTRYLVYYRVDDARAQVRVLAVRSALRGTQPTF
jgi:plasmid stabilization system protein ParE